MFSRPTESRTRPGRDPGSELLFGRELRMGRGCRMDDQAAHVADVGEMAEQADPVDERATGVNPALQFEGEHGSHPLRGVLFRQCVPGAGRQAGVVDGRDVIVAVEPLRDRLGVLDVALDPKAQRLDALDELPGASARWPSRGRAAAARAP